MCVFVVVSLSRGVVAYLCHCVDVPLCGLVVVSSCRCDVVWLCGCVDVCVVCSYVCACVFAC